VIPKLREDSETRHRPTQRARGRPHCPRDPAGPVVVRHRPMDYLGTRPREICGQSVRANQIAVVFANNETWHRLSTPPATAASAIRCHWSRRGNRPYTGLMFPFDTSDLALLERNGLLPDPVLRPGALTPVVSSVRPRQHSGPEASRITWWQSARRRCSAPGYGSRLNGSPFETGVDTGRPFFKDASLNRSALCGLFSNKETECCSTHAARESSA